MAAVICVGFVAIGFIVFRDRAINRAREQLIHTVDQSIITALADTGAFNFESANKTLEAVAMEIRQSRWADDYVGLELGDKIGSLQREVALKKSEHLARISTGWIMFAGKFMPMSDKKAILARREADRKRRQAEDARYARDLALEQKGVFPFPNPNGLVFPNPDEFRGYGPPSADRDRRILHDLRVMQEAVEQIKKRRP